MSVPPVALTCGEPAGIGPEITEAAWHKLREELPFFFIGDPSHLPNSVPHRVIQSPEEASVIFPDALPVLALDSGSPRHPGTPNRKQAATVIRSIELAVSFAQSGQACSVCTNPINKKALKDGADFPYPGHTEFLASLGENCDVVMMLASEALRVVPATIHIPINKVPAVLTPDLLETCLRVTNGALQRDFGIENPRIAVAGLNPHAGEGGTMGTEDDTIIRPVIERLKNKGMCLTGPLPADTMFHAKARKNYDAAVCMYHDQALIPIKTLAFDQGVNVTLGLPFIRTSPDHGTAFDIAGNGQADPTSLIEALRMAAELGAKRWQQ